MSKRGIFSGLCEETRMIVHTQFAPSLSRQENSTKRQIMHWQTKFAGIATVVGVAICFGALIPLAVAGLQTPGFPNNPPVGRHLPQYVLGPNDEITLMSVLVPEVANKPVRISTSGDINLPMVGRV